METTEIKKRLEKLSREDIKELKLVPGTLPENIVPGCHLHEPNRIEPNPNFPEGSYRGLIIYRSPKGNQIVTLQRDRSRGRPDIIMANIISLRRYDSSSGRINYGSSGRFYSRGDLGYVEI